MAQVGVRFWRQSTRKKTRSIPLILLVTAVLSACGAVEPSSALPAAGREAAVAGVPADAIRLPPSSLPALPADWDVSAAVWSDVTGDRVPEWALVVWRSWEDWPIQRWSAVPSPIAGFHDAAGDSCHLILLDPQNGHEIWAGSALPVPLLALAVEDVDGDGANEVITLEGSYASSRDGPGTRVDVWRWNGFGFTLQWRSPPGLFPTTCLAEAGRCGLSDAAAGWSLAIEEVVE